MAAIAAGLIGPLTAGRLNQIVAMGDILLGFGLHLAAQCALHYVVRAVDASPAEAGR